MCYAQYAFAQGMQAQAASAAAHFFDLVPLPAAMEIDDGVAFQKLYLEYLKARLGPPVGYKAALTTVASQRRFKAQQPVLGVLLRDMVLESPAALPRKFATRPLLEADLMVRVGKADIETAETDQEILGCLDVVAPFVEIPDLLFAPAVDLNSKQLEAVNVGARFGVMGQQVELRNMGDAFKQLASFEVELEGSDGVRRMRGQGSNLMGHPLNVVRWIRDRLKEKGGKLLPGDWLSLGSVTGLQAVVPGSEVRVRYLGLGGSENLEIIIKFN